MRVRMRSANSTGFLPLLATRTAVRGEGEGEGEERNSDILPRYIYPAANATVRNRQQ